MAEKKPLPTGTGERPPTPRPNFPKGQQPQAPPKEPDKNKQ
jgi:hypothetical protein